MKNKGELEVSLEKKQSILNMDIKDVKRNIDKFINKLMQQKNTEKKRNIVAFDIGSTVIKIAVGVYYKEKLSIDNCIQVPTPVNSIDDGVIKIREAIVNTLKQVLHENGIKAKDGICTTSSTTIINREILIPVVEEEEIETVVRFEIQQYLPINLDDCIIQTTILNQIQDVDGRNKLNVRVIAYPKKVALEYYKLLNELNLKPYALDVNFNALNKFINITEQVDDFEYNSKSSAAFLDIGANFIDVNIYKGGKLDFTRTIKAGVKDIDEMLIENGEVDREEISIIKSEKINLTEDELKMNLETRITKNVIDEWLDKIEMILKFYKNSNIENEINRIIVLGGGSKLYGLSEYMSDRLEIRVKKLKGVSNIAFNQNEFNDERICDYMNVIGSVIRL